MASQESSACMRKAPGVCRPRTVSASRSITFNGQRSTAARRSPAGRRELGGDLIRNVEDYNIAPTDRIARTQSHMKLLSPLDKPVLDKPRKES